MSTSSPVTLRTTSGPVTKMRPSGPMITTSVSAGPYAAPPAAGTEHQRELRDLAAGQRHGRENLADAVQRVDALGQPGAAAVPDADHRAAARGGHLVRRGRGPRSPAVPIAPPWRRGSVANAIIGTPSATSAATTTPSSSFSTSVISPRRCDTHHRVTRIADIAGVARCGDGQDGLRGSGESRHFQLLRKARETLCPPKPKEFDAAASGPERNGRGSSRATSMSIASSGSSRLRVGGARRSRRASRVAIASTAPAAPSRWPVHPLVAETTTESMALPRARRIASASATSPCGVEVAWALMCAMSSGCRPASRNRHRQCRGPLRNRSAPGRRRRARRRSCRRPPARHRSSPRGPMASDARSSTRIAGTLTHDEPVAPLVVGTRGRAGFVVTHRQGAHRGERGDRQRMDDRLRSAGDDHVSSPGPDHVERETQRLRARRAGGDRHMHPARAFSSRPIAAPGPFGMSIGTVCGLTREAPRSRIVSCWVRIVVSPPMPDVTHTPRRSGSISGAPASAHASRAATRATCCTRSSLRRWCAGISSLSLASASSDSCAANLTGTSSGRRRASARRCRRPAILARARERQSPKGSARRCP